MNGIKTNIKNAENLKSYLVENNILDYTHKLFIKNNEIFFPITKEVKYIDSELVNVTFEKKKESTRDIRKLLSKHLTESEISLLKTSFDLVGDIAIIEIPLELTDKEELIGSALSKLNKNIKVVLKKVGTHKGTFRTQDLEVIFGEPRKETIYRENNVLLKLNVETIYFSPRLSTERKRITKLVQDGEKVLVMFSGCGPYPCVISKNSNPSVVYGVEINPEGHKFALINKTLNKLKNVHLINGDVKQVIPEFNKYRFGKKLFLKDISEKLNSLKVVELQLNSGDLENFEVLSKVIKSLRDKKIKIIINSPNTFNGLFLDLNKNLKNTLLCYDRLNYLSDKYFCEGFIVHHDANNSDDEHIIKKLNNKYPYLFFNNLTLDKPQDYFKFINKIKPKNIYFDVGTYLLKNKTPYLIETIRELKQITNIYFNLMDVKDSKRNDLFDDGLLDNFKLFNEFMDLIDISSAPSKNLNELFKIDYRFDRVLMPLPKSADDFLSEAISIIKKNGIIHFYDFLNKDEIPDFAIDKIQKVNSNIQILNWVYCGQYSPYKFRICVDFKKL